MRKPDVRAGQLWHYSHSGSHSEWLVVPLTVIDAPNSWHCHSVRCYDGVFWASRWLFSSNECWELLVDA